MRRSLACFEAAGNRAWNGLPENAATARQRNGIECAASGRKRARKGGRLRRRGNRNADAANRMKPAGLNIMMINNLRFQRGRLKRLA
jgi:head-tail adaptor